MTPDPRNYALCLSDAGFSRDVLAALRRRAFLPRLVALPEYAPAAPSGDPGLLVAPQRELDRHIGDIPRIYVPRGAQAGFARRLRDQQFGCLLVACWPYLLEHGVIEAVEPCALNLHPSLLPRYRGPDPIGAQLARGDPKFGVSLHLLDAAFDRGDLVAQAAFEADADKRNRREIEARAADLGAELFIEAMRVGAGRWKLRRQEALPDTD